MKHSRMKKIQYGVLVLMLLVLPMGVPDLIFFLYQPEVNRATRPFQFPQDRFAFANETVWNYADGELQGIGLPDEMQEQQQGARYSRRCFVLSRAALQFFKFASFQPEQPGLSEQELVQRLRKLVAVDVWREPLEASQRIVFPGFSGVDDLSRLHPQLLQQYLGAGWTTYIRLGNFGIPLPLSSGHQQRTFEFLEQSLQVEMPVILWLVNFPSLNINHTVLVYRQREINDDVHIFEVYDPNDTSEAKELHYDASSCTFSFQRTFYFPGGDVKVRPVYLSPLQ